MVTISLRHHYSAWMLPQREALARSRELIVNREFELNTVPRLPKGVQVAG